MKSIRSNDIDSGMDYKYLYIKNIIDIVSFKYLTDANIKTYYRVKINGFIFKVFRKLNKLNLLFGDWKKQVQNYDCIILGENDYIPEIAKYIKTKNKNARVIMYYWNILNRDEYIKILDDKNIDEFWTFDKNDAKKFNLKYNPQFYTSNIKLKNENIDNDVMFVGRAKTRKDELIGIKDKLENKGIKTLFKIIENEKDYISYEEYLKLVSSSKCIVDFNQVGQVGLTLRPMESLFLERKLITNNEDIINYDFYNKDNIFVIGKDDEQRLYEFINSPYSKVDENIVKYYDFESWINRIIENESVDIN